MIFFVKCLLTKNEAILLNTSKGYHNYRHIANISIFYKILIENGFQESDIKYLTCENLIYDNRNTKNGFVNIEKDEYFKIPYIKPKSTTINEFLNIIYQISAYNVFIYMCGHGGESFLKFYDKECLLKNDLMMVIKRLSRNVNKIFLIIDTCHAEALIDSVPENVTVICTSLKNEPSISSHVDNGPNLIDNFPYIFYKKFNLELKIKDFVDLFDFDELGSHIFFDGDENVKLKEFFSQQIQRVTKFNI